MHIGRLAVSALMYGLILFQGAPSAHAVGYYTPPCEKEWDVKEQDLGKLNRCLRKQGEGPFDEKATSPANEVCPEEMNRFISSLNAYRLCIKPG